MNEQKELIQEQDQEKEESIDYILCAKTLWKCRKTILLWGFVGCVVGFIYALGLPNVYSSETILSPESQKRNVAGGLGSLASMAGINIGSLSPSADALTVETFPDILDSNPFVFDLFNTKVKFNYGDEVVETTIYDYLDNYTFSSWWSVPFRLPGLILSLFKDDKDETPATTDPINFSRKQDIIAKSLRKNISITVDKKTQQVTINTKFQNPMVTAQICNAVVVLLKKYVTQYRTEKARNNTLYYETLFKQKQQEYFDAQQNLAKYLDANQMVTRKGNLIEEERLKNDVELAYAIYTTCAKELESAKVILQQETPVFAIVKPAAIPNLKTSPSKIKFAIGFGFFAFLVLAFKILVLEEKIVKFW